jgi:hypothetical protein
MSIVKGVEARQRDFTESFMKSEIKRIKNNCDKNDIADYFDEYDIGWTLQGILSRK